MISQPMLESIPPDPMTLVRALCSSTITWSTCNWVIVPPKRTLVLLSMVLVVRMHVIVVMIHVLVLMVVRLLKIVVEVEVCVMHTHMMLIHVVVVAVVI